MPYGTAPPSPPIGWGKPSIKPGEIPPTAVAAYPPQYCREVHFAHFKDVYTGGSAPFRPPVVRGPPPPPPPPPPRHADTPGFSIRRDRAKGCWVRWRALADDLDALPIDASDVAVAGVAAPEPEPDEPRPAGDSPVRAWRWAARRAAAARGRRADEETAREHVALEEIGAQADELGPIGAGKAPLAVFVTEAPDPDYRARGRKTDCSGAFRAASVKPGGKPRSRAGARSGKTAGHWQLSGKIAEAKWHRGGEVSLEHEFPPAPAPATVAEALGRGAAGRVVYSTSREVARRRRLRALRLKQSASAARLSTPRRARA